jgi:cell wall-associated NlpC family hydrolase
MYGMARKIPLSALQPGDLVFYGSPVHHVALYIGGGQIIHAPHTGSYVQVASISYWSDLAGAGRV